MTEETRTCPICGHQHRRGIGGSMMSQILGLSQWGNALDAYHALTRPDALYADEEIQSIDLFRGNALEPEIGPWYTEETGEPVRPWEGCVEHPDYPAFMGHPDYAILDADGEVVGIMEAKAPRAWRFAQVYEHGLRMSETVQLQTYAAIARIGKAAFGFACLEHEAGPLLPVPLPVDKELGGFLLEVGQRFWDEHVVPRVPPDPEEWKVIQDPDAPAAVETQGEREDVTDDQELTELLRATMEAQELEKRGKAMAAERKQALQSLMEDRCNTDRIRVPGVAKVTVVRSAGRSSLSRRALEGHRPIDRDKLWRMVTEDGVDRLRDAAAAEDLDTVLSDLELDLDAFERQGCPFSYPLITPEKQP